MLKPHDSQYNPHHLSEEYSLFNKNNFDEVIKIGTILYEDHKNLTILPNLIGASFAGIDNHKNAIIFYNKALELNNIVENDYDESINSENLDQVNDLEKSEESNKDDEIS